MGTHRTACVNRKKSTRCSIVMAEGGAVGSVSVCYKDQVRLAGSTARATNKHANAPMHARQDVHPRRSRCVGVCMCASVRTLRWPDDAAVIAMHCTHRDGPTRLRKPGRCMHGMCTRQGGARRGHPGPISADVACMTEFIVSVAAYCLFCSLGDWSAPWMYNRLEPCWRSCCYCVYTC